VEVVPGAVTVVSKYGLGLPIFVNPILPLGAIGVLYALRVRTLPTHCEGIFEIVTDLSK
jgi:hypothetical protein